MTRTPSFSRAWSAALAIAASVFSLALATAPALADGTVRIQHANGSVDTYPNTKIKIIHNALYVTTADGSGTLVISKAACFYQHKLLVCLPTGVTLVQAGNAKPLDITVGTLYFNFTKNPHQLTASTMTLAPNSVLLSLNTKRGTYISLSGTIDKAE